MRRLSKATILGMRSGLCKLWRRPRMVITGNCSSESDIDAAHKRERNVFLFSQLRNAAKVLLLWPAQNCEDE